MRSEMLFFALVQGVDAVRLAPGWGRAAGSSCRTRMGLCADICLSLSPPEPTSPPRAVRLERGKAGH